TEHLGVIDEDSPERGERAVDGTFAAAHRRDPRLERHEPLLRPRRIDAHLLRSIEAMRAEASDRRRISAATVTGADRVVEWSLPFAAPHQSLNVVRPQIILDHSKPEVSRVRIPGTRPRRPPAMQIDFGGLFETANVAAKDIFEP